MGSFFSTGVGGTNSGQGANGYLAQSLPLEAVNGTGAMASGTRYVIRVPLSTPITFTTVSLNVSNAGSVLTSGQSLIAVYDKNGTQVGSTSADQSGVWTSTGQKTATVGSPGQVDTNVYVEIISVGTTPPTMRTGTTQSLFNGLLSGASLRCSVNGTSQTTVDTSITTSGLASANSFSFWIGLS